VDKERQDKYHQLTKEQKAEVVKEYEKHKALVARGTCISARSRANDAVRMIGCVENMVRKVQFDRLVQSN
jgi:hypothetical protein